MLQIFGNPPDFGPALVRSVFFWCCAAAGGFLMGRTVERFLPAGKGFVRRIAPYVLFVVVIEMPSWIGDENPLLLFPFFLAVFLLSYGGSWLARLTCGLMFYALLMPLNMMLDTLGLWGIELELSSIAGLLCKLAAWTVAFYLVRRTVPAGAVHLSNRLWTLAGALSLAPVFAMLAFSIWGWNRRSTFWDIYEQAAKPIAFTILPFVLLSAAAILCAVVLLSRNETLEREHALADMREVYYQGLQREQKQVRTLRHDMNNHLTALHGLLEQGETQKARAYLDELAVSPALRGTRRLCENETANVVLSSKLADLEETGLTADFAVELPAALSVAVADLTALLGNALDNAIEAARDAADKRITVRARADKGLLMLRVSNAYAGGRTRKNGAFSTTKADKRSHGFGLAGMNEIAARYGGTLGARAENGRFELIVCLPLRAET